MKTKGEWNKSQRLFGTSNTRADFYTKYGRRRDRHQRLLEIPEGERHPTRAGR